VASRLEVVKAWVDACNQGDVDGALALCDPSIELVEARTLPGAVTAAGTSCDCSTPWPADNVSPGNQVALPRKGTA
jgi:hypothetical protein